MYKLGLAKGKVGLPARMDAVRLAKVRRCVFGFEIFGVVHWLSEPSVTG